MILLWVILFGTLRNVCEFLDHRLWRRITCPFALTRLRVFYAGAYAFSGAIGPCVSIQIAPACVRSVGSQQSPRYSLVQSVYTPRVRCIRLAPRPSSVPSQFLLLLALLRPVLSFLVAVSFHPLLYRRHRPRWAVSVASRGLPRVIGCDDCISFDRDVPCREEEGAENSA